MATVASPFTNTWTHRANAILSIVGISIHPFPYHFPYHLACTGGFSLRTLCKWSYGAPIIFFLMGLFHPCKLTFFSLHYNWFLGLWFYGKYMRSLLEWGSLGYLGICWSSPTQTTAEAMKGLICTNSYTPSESHRLSMALFQGIVKKNLGLWASLWWASCCFIKYCKVVGSLGFSCIKCYAMMIGHPRSMDDWSDFSTKNKISPTQDTRRAPSRSL